MNSDEQDLARVLDAGGGMPELLALARRWASTGKAASAADLLLTLADSAVEAGRGDAALDFLDAFDEVVASLDVPHEVRVWRLRVEGLARMDRGELHAALELAESALVAARATGMTNLVVPIALQAGAVALELDDPVAAEKRFRAALRGARRLRDRDLTAQALVNLANVALHLDRLSEAKALLGQADATGAGSTNPHLRSSIVGSRGVIAVREGDWESAERLNREALADARRSRDAIAEIVAMQNLASVLVEEGDPGLAVRWYRKAISLCREVGAQRKAAELNAALALSLLASERSREAADAFEAAHADFAALNDQAMAARMTADRGAAELAAGRNQEAEAVLRQAATQLAKLGDRAWWALTQSNLAELQYRTGEPEAAAAAMERALAEIGSEDHERRARMLWRLADYLTALGPSEQLVRVLREALDEDAVTLPVSQLAWRFGLAAAYTLSAGDPESSIRLLGEALLRAGTDAEAAFHLRNDLGIALMEVGRLDESEAEFAAAMRLANRRRDRVMQIQAAQNLGETLRRQGRAKRAVRELQRGARIASALADTAAEASILGNLGIALVDVGNLTEAEETFRRALELGLHGREPAAVATALGGLASLAFGSAEYSVAAQLYGRAARAHPEGHERHEVEDLAGWVESLAAANATRRLTHAAQRLVTAAQASSHEDIAWPALANAARWYGKRQRLDRAAEFYAIAILLAGTSGKRVFEPAIDEREPGFAAMIEAVMLMLVHSEEEGFPVTRLLERVQAVLAGNYGLPPEPTSTLLMSASEAWASRIGTA